MTCFFKSKYYFYKTNNNNSQKNQFPHFLLRNLIPYNFYVTNLEYS